MVGATPSVRLTASPHYAAHIIKSRNSFPCHTYKNRAAKSFACHTSKNRVCKSFSCHTFSNFKLQFHLGTLPRDVFPSGVFAARNLFWGCLRRPARPGSTQGSSYSLFTTHHSLPRTPLPGSLIEKDGRRRRRVERLHRRCHRYANPRIGATFDLFRQTLAFIADEQSDGLAPVNLPGRQQRLVAFVRLARTGCQGLNSCGAELRQQDWQCYTSEQRYVERSSRRST